MKSPLIGVLALQGGVREHSAALTRLGVATSEVRTPADLERVDALILPGGESSVIEKLLKLFALEEPLRARLSSGMPAYGTCAGLILLANHIEDASPGQRGLGGLDVSVRRNAFGSQSQSFEASITFRGIPDPIHTAFIRAPRIESVGPGARELARLDDGTIVAARGENILGTAFHPELTGDDRVHAYFLKMVQESA